MEHETHVDTKYGKVIIRKIYLKHNTGECRVTLWRTHAPSNTELGSFYKLTHLSASKYEGWMSYSTTHATKRGELHSL